MLLIFGFTPTAEPPRYRCASNFGYLSISCWTTATAGSSLSSMQNSSSYVGYCMVKKVSRFCERFGSPPISGFKIETAGSGDSRGSRHGFLCNLIFLRREKRKSGYESASISSALGKQSKSLDWALIATLCANRLERQRYQFQLELQVLR